MRITGGTLGGRVLKAPKNDATRPSSDRTRETIFNILQNGMGIEFKVTLDLFAGSGAVGIETLSRGGVRSILFEADRAAIKCIEVNLNCLGLAQKTTLIAEKKIEKWAEILKMNLASTELIDFVFCDPPYKKGLAMKAMKAFSSAAISCFSPNCIWISELDKDEKPQDTPKEWQILKERICGPAKLVVYRRSLS